jgi:hypothetical protein
LAARAGRQHGRAVIEHEQIARPLWAGPVVLRRGRHTRELEDHDERVALVEAPDDRGRDLAAHRPLRDARHQQRADPGDVEPALERPGGEARLLEGNLALEQDLLPALKTVPRMEPHGRKQWLHQSFTLSGPPFARSGKKHRAPGQDAPVSYCILPASSRNRGLIT